MNVEWWLELLKESWPLAILIALVWVMIRVAKWASPWLEKIFKSTLEFLDKGIEVNEKNSKALSGQTPVLRHINEDLDSISDEVIRIGDRTIDKESLISNYHTNESLRIALNNDREFANVGLLVIDVLTEHHPDLKSGLNEAKSILIKIASGDK